MGLRVKPPIVLPQDELEKIATEAYIQNHSVKHWYRITVDGVMQAESSDESEIRRFHEETPGSKFERFRQTFMTFAEPWEPYE